MENALTNFNDVLTNIKARIGLLGREREAYRTEAESKFKEIDDLITIIGHKIGNLEQLKAANTALEQENARLRKEIESLNNIVSKLQSDKDNIERQIKDLKTANVELTTENANIKIQIESLTKELAAKTEELVTKTVELTNAKKLNNDLNSEINKNIALINTTTQQLEQELGRLNEDNTQIDAEIIRKLEELSVRLAGMGSGSGAAAAMSSDRSARLAERLSRAYYVGDGIPTPSMSLTDC